MNVDPHEYDPYYDPYQNQPWKCPKCGIGNRGDRKDCRMCMCPKENICSKCRKINEGKARYCRFCGSLTEFNRYNVFDPAERKKAARSSKATDRKYRAYGHYYQWEDGPYQGPEEMYW